MSKILIGISGSIAAYRTYDVVKDLVRLGNEVKVILTKGAQEFVKAEMYTFMGAQNVYLPQDDFKNYSGVLHIDLARWCDRFVLCPASANTIAKLSHGMADDLLSSVFLSLGSKPTLIFPAMNTYMWDNPLTQENLANLTKQKHIKVITPKSGVLICSEVGLGKLATSAELTELIDSYHVTTAKAKNILITTGATLSPLDPIRYLTNGSTGTMGKILAKEFLKQGHHVTVVASQTSTNELNYFQSHPNFTLIRISTAEDMLETVKKYFPKCNLFIATAAVNDLTFKKSKKKIKKAELPTSLAVTPNPDILATMLKSKKSSQKIIGFGGEYPCTEKLLIEKWKRKKVDLLVGNEIETPASNRPMRGYGNSSNEYWLVAKGKLVSKQTLSKSELAKYLSHWYQNNA